MAKASAAPKKKAPTKSEVYAAIADKTGLAKKEVAAVLDALHDQIKLAMSNKGAGVFQIPGLLKITKKKMPARPAQKGVPNPFKPGELMDRPAKAAYNKIKVLALKNLKSMA